MLEKNHEFSEQGGISRLGMAGAAPVGCLDATGVSDFTKKRSCMTMITLQNYHSMESQGCG